MHAQKASRDVPAACRGRGCTAMLVGVHLCVPLMWRGVGVGRECPRHGVATKLVQAVTLFTDLPSFFLLIQQHLKNTLFPSSPTFDLFSTFCWRCLLCSGRWMSQHAHCFVTQGTVDKNLTLRWKVVGTGKMRRLCRDNTWKSMWKSLRFQEKTQSVQYCTFVE